MILFIVVILVSLFVKSYNGYPSHSYPTPTSTTIPTIPSATPSTAPTKSDVGDPKKCHGCKWLQKQGWAIKSGQDKCKSRINVKVKGEKGKCLAGLSGKQCIPEPCQYKYEVKYSIKQRCVKNKSCVLIVSDPYTAGTAPTTPIVTLIEKEKGKIKKLEIKVECQCKTNIKLFKLQCETPTGTSSKSIMLDYSCSECDLMYLPGELWPLNKFYVLKNKIVWWGLMLGYILLHIPAQRFPQF